MYILTSDQKSIVDTSYAERICLVEKPDAYLIIASYGPERAVTIGKYAGKDEAYGVLVRLHAELASGSTAYIMPDSPLFGGEQVKHDSRTRRRGGS